MKRDEAFNIKLLASKIGEVIVTDECNISVVNFEQHYVKGCKLCIFDTTYCPKVNGVLCCKDGKLFVKSVRG